jgi:tetratricopeptide (TPR) repeat protein
MSLRELAARALSSKSHLHDFETARKLPSVETAQRLDQVLNASGTLISLRAGNAEAGSTVRRREFLNLGTAAAYVLAAPSAGQDVAARTARTARLRRLDDYLGGADTYTAYAAEMRRTADALRDSPDDAGLLGVMAEQEQMTGWAAFDAGWQAEASRLFELSLSNARRAGSGALAANALAFMGYQAPSVGRSGTDLASLASEVGTRSTPKVRALLAEREAWAHAVEQRHPDVERCLDQAAEAVSETSASEPDWTFWIDETEIKIMTGRCWSLLGRPLRAIGTLEDALDGYDNTHGRDKAMYLVALADAYLDANEVEHSCATVHTAMDLATGVRSLRPAQRVAAFVERAGDRPERCVVELRSRAREWISTARALPAQPSRGTTLSLGQP